MNYSELNKAELKTLCEDNGVEFTDKDTKKSLVEKLESLQNVEIDANETPNTETIVDNDSAKVTSEAFHTVDSDKKVVLYFSKQRWHKLGEFDSQEDIEKAVARKGISVWCIEGECDDK